MTVITVVAIAAIAAIFYVFVWPSIQLNLQATSACSGGPENVGGTDKISWECGPAGENGKFQCKVSNEAGKSTTKQCSNS